MLRAAPHTHAISRPDEVKAAKEPVLRWDPPRQEPAQPLAVGAAVLVEEWANRT